MAYTGEVLCDAEPTEDPGKLSEIRDRIRGYAQTIERLGSLTDDFLRRCTGGLSVTASGSVSMGEAKSPVAPSHFHRIDDTCERLESALKYLDQRVGRLSEIG